MKTLEFIFDFASPNAYLVHKVLPGLAARTGAKLDYKPCLLGGIFKATGNRAPMIQFADIKGKVAYDMIEFNRFIAKHGLTSFKMNPHFPVNTVLAMRGAIAAEMEGNLAPYIDAVLHHMWEAPKKMDDPEIFVEALNESGLDGAALAARTQDDDVKAKLIENTEAAVSRGVFGIPTFFIGNDMFFGKERLGQVEEALLA
jgi:2-hydroxychromene-2-carboxylate isomerase